MKIFILAAGQGTRLRPLTDNIPKCMVEVNGRSIVARQIETMLKCGINESNIYIISGYREDKLKGCFSETKVNFVTNNQYETTNMVYSLMCAKHIIEKENDVLISYGDIIYTPEVLKKILSEEEEMSVITDDEWFSYWSERTDDPLSDAETLLKDKDGYLTEIGQKTNDMSKIQSQYIGLIRFKNKGVTEMLRVCKEAQSRSEQGKTLWRTQRNYNKMYMTDLLQGLIDEGNRLKAIPIARGWFEVDCENDLHIAEKYLLLNFPS